MLHTKGTLCNSVVSLTCTVSLWAAMLAALTLSSCHSNAGEPTKKNADSSLVVLPHPVSIPAYVVDRYRQEGQRWYDSLLRKTGFNGGMLIAKSGNVVFEVYNGTGHPGGTDTITPNTSFHIASVSKTFTAMAVLKLAQDGKINIDDEFVKYFPGFNYPGVTIRTLLDHRSGLPNYVHFMENLGWDKDKYVTNQDVYDYLVNRKQELTDIGRPDTRFTYCNSNYALLALLIEKVTGEKYPQFMQRTFFKPLQMKHSFVFDTSMIGTVIPSYDWKGELIPYNFLDAVYGDKNIYSTPEDLLTWHRALMSHALFSDSTLMEAYTPYSNEKPGIRNYGLGWRMNIYPNQKKMIYHNGWWHGNNASFIRLLEPDATIIVLGNKFNRNIYHAKDLTVLFGDYGNGVEEEEETNGDAKNTNAAAATTKKTAAAQKRKKR